jgi:hypothetical protein
MYLQKPYNNFNDLNDGISQFGGDVYEDKNQFIETTYKNNKKITDKNGIIRFDFQFSYWIFIWFIFYYIIYLQRERSPLTQKIYKYCNPIISLIIAFIENIIVFIILLFYNPPFLLVIKYLFMLLVIKIIPLYLLYRTLPTNPSYEYWKSSFFAFVCVFSIYNLYLLANETNIIDIYISTVYFIFNNKNKTFFFYYIYGFWNNI